MFSRSFYPFSEVFYAQSCPEEPLVLEIPQEFMPTSKTRSTTKKLIHQSSYRPRILTNSKGHTQSEYVSAQHARQIASLKKRIRECKSWTQRKKDHNDPIIYPSYFIRGKKECKDARIDGYFKRVVSQQTNKHNLTPTKKTKLLAPRRPTSDLINSQFFQLPDSVPSIVNQYRRQLWTRDLPDCNLASVISFIIRKQVYLHYDLSILRARMVHYYGEQEVELIWSQVVQYLGSHG